MMSTKVKLDFLDDFLPFLRYVTKLFLLHCVPSTRKVKALSLPETIKEKSTFQGKALRRELVVCAKYPIFTNKILLMQ